MKFFERFVLKEMKEFQDLDTEEKKRYIMLYGHYHFSQWLAGLAVQPWVMCAVSTIVIILAVLDMAMILLVEDRTLYMTVFFISFPFMAIFTYMSCHIIKVYKMDEETFKEWYQDSKDKIQNLLFGDYRIFTIRNRMYVKRTDNTFYKSLQSEECCGECYRCSFKLALLLNDPKVKILWFAATGFGDTGRYGHAVIEKNGFILDTNTRKCYNKDQYLKAQKAEIFYEYSLEQYHSVETPWDLKWEEFGKWCEARNVQRNN